MQNPLNVDTTLVFVGSAYLLPFLFASHYNMRFSLSKIFKPTRFGNTWSIMIGGNLSFIRVILFFIDVQRKRKIVQTLAWPTLNLINLCKMHFVVKVQSFHSSHIAGGISGSRITVGLVTRCSIVRTLSWHTVGRGRARSGRQRELSTCHISPSSSPW